MINKKYQILILCLECIDLYNLANLKLENNQKFNDLVHLIYKKYKQNNANVHHYSPYSSLLNQIYHFTSKHYIQKNITHILEDYSTNQDCIDNTSKLTQQYLKKFVYKYQKFYANINLKIQYSYYYSKISQIHKIAIFNLYILKKVQGKEGIYKFFKYFQTT